MRTRFDARAAALWVCLPVGEQQPCPSADEPPAPPLLIRLAAPRVDCGGGGMKISIYIRLSICIYLSIYVSISISIYLPTYLYPSISVSVALSLSSYPSIVSL